MAFDPGIARRMLHNNRLRVALGGSDIYDLRGAIALTSDAPIPALNCLAEFNTRPAHVEALLDIGFALLRAFDRDPAVEVTPLDRPRSLPKQLARRRLVRTEKRAWMVLRRDAAEIPVNTAVEVRIAGPEDAREFARLHASGTAWVRRLSLHSQMAANDTSGNTFYLGCLDGEPVATLHMLIDGTTAGIYAVGTQRAHRRKGISSTLMARAIADARAAGCDVISLSTAANAYAERLYAKHGFERAFTSDLWILHQPVT
ncbi:MAG: GNAT family N-acetyltransferase [Chloroflexi bacterium]|nr:GNAT family N-acetyltransferase [Chloroflexota bacterium]